MKPRKHIIPIFIPHLGCPNDCVFCNQRKISGKLKPATAEVVISAIIAAKSVLSSDLKPELAFYGGSFTAIPIKEQLVLLEAALPFLHDGTIGEIRISTRPDAIDENKLDILKKFGVKTIELGAQSMDEEVLLKSGRGHTAKDTENASRLIKELGFKLVLQMMTGLPGDNEEKSIETAKKIIMLSPDGVRIYPTVILKDTALYELWKNGDYNEHSLENAIKLGAKIYKLFSDAGIPVIRFGLNPSDELSGGEAVGGAYHPALGELVRSRLYLDRARSLLSESSYSKDIVLGVNRGCISLMTGQKRSNIIFLKEEFELNTLKVLETEIPDGDTVVILH